MGRNVLSSTDYRSVSQHATAGGTRSATTESEARVDRGEGLDVTVDPRGFPHLGPVRMSLPRFVELDNGLWQLTVGMPMPVETLLDTTGSMQDNVDIAFRVLPLEYALLTGGETPVLGRYDVQICNACFGDVDDPHWKPGSPVLCRSQFEMDVKIAEQAAKLVPSRNGCGNGKEDPQFGLFGAAYLTKPTIIRYDGMRHYHFAVSDEPVAEYIDYAWLKAIYGDTFLDAVAQNGFDLAPNSIPHLATVVRTLQQRAHAFFLQVGNSPYVTVPWTRLYGKEHVIALPDGTRSIHLVKAAIIGLTEGVLTLSSTEAFLRANGAEQRTAKAIVRAVANIPIGAQTLAPDFNRLPRAGDLFRNKTDLWPMTPEEIAAYAAETGKKVDGSVDDSGAKPNVEWL